MHLSKLTLRRFRSCEEVTIDFRTDLTVLVGENNGGKSNVVDALRLLTLPLNGRRERYPDDEDVRREATPRAFEIVAEYRGLSDTLKGLLVTAVPDPTRDVAIFGYRFTASSDSAPRGRTTLWAGKFDTAEPELGSTDLIRHVYLPALRDAHQALGSASGARVMALFRHFLPTQQEKDDFVETARRSAASGVPGVITTVNSQIAIALGALTSGVRPQGAQLDFGTETLLDVARSLRFKLADAGLKPEDIRASGLGYSNLLYMATVLVELARAKEADLTLVLVEEPEAHLHPQLQMLVLEFLREKATESSTKTPPSGQPEGRIQVIVTTHSPNLTASVAPEHLVVVRSEKLTIGDRVVSRTKSVPIARLGIDPKSLAKIGRYLDVTRSAILFGNRTLLVEGVAESLLLPAIARRLTLKKDQAAWLRFKGAVIVPIDGVDFRPYVEVLLRPHNNARIADRVVVVTDADPTVDGNRKDELETLANGFGATTALHVFVNQVTLEHEMFSAGNEVLLKAAFLTLHPRSNDDWTTLIESIAKADRPNAFLEMLKSKRTRKGDLAQEIAARIDAEETFHVPAYLDTAIKKIAEP